jgi:hypothetical protein
VDKPDTFGFLNRCLVLGNIKRVYAEGVIWYAILTVQEHSNVIML